MINSRRLQNVNIKGKPGVISELRDIVKGGEAQMSWEEEIRCEDFIRKKRVK